MTEKTTTTQSTNSTVLPAELPPGLEKFLKKALHIKQIDRGFTWSIEKMDDDHKPSQLIAEFIEKYEGQIARLEPQVIEKAGPVFRAALIRILLSELHRYRMKLADKGYNYIFVETALQRRLLATILGITIHDVQRKINLSGRKPPQYLSDELDRLMRQTFLNKMV